jgi:hypothetical protein
MANVVITRDFVPPYPPYPHLSVAIRVLNREFKLYSLVVKRGPPQRFAIGPLEKNSSRRRISAGPAGGTLS